MMRRNALSETLVPNESALASVGRLEPGHVVDGANTFGLQFAE